MYIHYIMYVLIANITTHSSHNILYCFYMHALLGVYSLVSLKTLMGIVLLGVSCGYQGTEKAGEATTTIRVSDISVLSGDLEVRGGADENKGKKTKETTTTTDLSKVERYSLCSNRIV